MASSPSDLSNHEALTPAAQGGALTATPPTLPLPGGVNLSRGPANDLLYGGFNQTWLINGLRRKWLTSLLMGALIGVLVGGLLYWLFPASSRTTAYLQMQFGEDTTFGEPSKLNAEQLKQAQFSQLTLIKSSSVLKNALAPSNIRELSAVQANMPEPEQWMYEELKVSFPNNGDVMEVRYDGEEDPKEMEQVVQAVVNTYYKEVVDKERVDRFESLFDLQKVQEELQRRLTDKMNDYKKKKDLADGADSETAEIEISQLTRKLDFYRSELSRVEKDIVNAEVMRDVAVNEANSPAVREAWVQQSVDSDPMIADYRKQLFTIDQEILARQAVERRKNSPMIERLQQQKSQIASLEAQYRQKTEGELREKYDRMPNLALQSAMTQYKAIYERLSAQKASLEEELKTSEEHLMQLGAHDPSIALLENEIENSQEVVHELELRLSELSIKQKARESAAGNTGRHEQVKKIQDAIAQPNINVYERWAIVGVGSLAGFALTCYGVALMDFRKRKLNGASEVDEGLGIRVLGVLPATTARRSLAGGSMVSALVSESIDSVRATLMHASTKMRRQLVLVTSPETMEGATTVAANLALSLARAGRRTLLVDGDLRAPSLHALFGLSLDGGFSEVLRSEIDLADAIHPTQTESLYVLPAGRCDSRAVQTLATDQLEAIFNQLRTQFDFIIVDTPPVLQLADGLAIARFVDGAILTVLRDHSEVRKINKAAEILDSLGIRIIGSVVNGVPVKADRRVARLQRSAQKALPAKASKPAKPAKAKKDKKAKAADASAASVAPAATLEEPPAASSVAESAELDPLDIDIDDFNIEFDDK